jgi:hypothetical protein
MLPLVPANQLPNWNSLVGGCPGKTFGQLFHAFEADHVQMFSSSAATSGEWSKVCGRGSSMQAQPPSGQSPYHEVPGSKYGGSGTWSGDPCDLNDLIARQKRIENTNSLAATDAKQEIKKEMDARMAACIANANGTKVADPSVGGPAVAMPLQDAAGNSSIQSLLNPDPTADSLDLASASGEEMKKETEDFLNSLTSKKEGVLESLKDAFAPFDLLGEGFEASATASTGNLPAHAKSIDALKEYVDKEADMLNELAHKNQQDWLAYSGVTPDLESSTAALQRLDDMSSQLAIVQDVTQRLLPSVKAAALFLEAPAVQGARAAAAETTLTGLDGAALDWVWSRLSSTSRDIEIIQNNIRAARSAMH